MKFFSHLLVLTPFPIVPVWWVDQYDISFCSDAFFDTWSWLRTGVDSAGTRPETLSAPDLWMIRPKPRRHLSYRLQNVTSALGVLFSSVFRFASQSEKRNKNRIVNKIVISRNFVDCLQWWYGSDSEKNPGRVWRLCLGSDKSFEQFSHNHCQVSQMLSHPCLAQICLNWPVAWTRTERRVKNDFPLQSEWLFPPWNMKSGVVFLRLHFL